MVEGKSYLKFIKWKISNIAFMGRTENERGVKPEIYVGFFDIFFGIIQCCIACKVLKDFGSSIPLFTNDTADIGPY